MRFDTAGTPCAALPFAGYGKRKGCINHARLPPDRGSPAA